MPRSTWDLVAKYISILADNDCAKKNLGCEIILFLDVFGVIPGIPIYTIIVYNGTKKRKNNVPLWFDFTVLFPENGRFQETAMQENVNIGHVDKPKGFGEQYFQTNPYFLANLTYPQPKKGKYQQLQQKTRELQRTNVPFKGFP
jgi:hypothetical protein